jgi:hypothetical protein
MVFTDVASPYVGRPLLGICRPWPDGEWSSSACGWRSILRSGASLVQEWGQEPEQVRLIPSSGLAFALDPDFQTLVLLQEVQCQTA